MLACVWELPRAQNLQCGCEISPGEAAFVGSDGVLVFVSLVPPLDCFSRVNGIRGLAMR